MGFNLAFKGLICKWILLQKYFTCVIVNPSDGNSISETPKCRMGWESDLLWAGWSGDQIPVGGEISHTCPDWPWGPPSILYNGYWVFPWGKVTREWH